MHTRILPTVLLAAVIICVLGAGVAHAELKIGYIRSNYIFKNYEPYDEAQKQLQTLHEEQVGLLEKMRTDYEADVREAQQNQMLMTDESRNMKVEALQKQELEIQERYQEILGDNGMIIKKQEELMQPIFDRINEAVGRIFETEGYDFIFDVNTAAGSPILYASDKHDLSDQALDELNKGGGAE